jgi:glutaredoxin-related protein
MSHELPEDLVGLVDFCQVERVEGRDYLVVEDVAKHLKAFFRWPAMKQEHPGHVAHPLDVSNIWP